MPETNLPEGESERKPKAAGCNLFARNIGFASYKAYLRSEHWKEFRRGILAMSPRCKACRKARATTVHHITYDRLGQEWAEDVRTVCQPCHERIHRIHHEQRIPLKDFNAVAKKKERRRRKRHWTANPSEVMTYTLPLRQRGVEPPPPLPAAPPKPAMTFKNFAAHNNWKPNPEIEAHQTGLGDFALSGSGVKAASGLIEKAGGTWDEPTETWLVSRAVALFLGATIIE